MCKKCAKILSIWYSGLGDVVIKIVLLFNF